MDEILADMSRLGLGAEREEIERLVAVEARRRELEGDTGSQEFYNDKVLLIDMQSNRVQLQPQRLSRAFRVFYPVLCLPAACGPDHPFGAGSGHALHESGKRTKPKPETQSNRVDATGEGAGGV